MDIVIPLASAESKTDNLELRIALRSIAKNVRGVGNIWLITDNPPKWAKDVKVIEAADTINNCKDANLINKVLAACNHEEVSDNFIFWSDDQVANMPVDINDIRPSYNNRGIGAFNPNGNKWALRMINTLVTVRAAGGTFNINWDSHVPQPYDKHLFKAIMTSIPYTHLPGFCINTAYFGLKFEPPVVNQVAVKQTVESEFKGTIGTHTFLGYNDKGFNTGLKEALLEKFSEQCIYEKTGIED